MDEQLIVNKVLDRLGANDGVYEFMMEHYGKMLRRKGMLVSKEGHLHYKPGQSLIHLIKFIRGTPGFFTPEVPGLKLSKDCAEGDGILVGYFTAQTRDAFIATLESFDITPDCYIFTKEEN